MAFKIQETSDGVIIDVVIQPKSSRDEIVGIHGDYLKIKLTAPPVDGKANAALIAFLAKKLGIAKSRIKILRGETSRRKSVLLENVSENEAYNLLIGPPKQPSSKTPVL